MPHRGMPALSALAALAACAPAEGPGRDADPVRFVDLSRATGIDDQGLGHYTRGRTCAPADFDGDGRLDLFVGGPGDPGVLLHTRPTGQGAIAFEGEVLSDEGTAIWAAAALDLDGDGDPDLFAGTGGNETEELDQVFLNQEGRLVEQPPAEPLAGPPGALGDPFPTATSGARWGDLDLDGDLDLFLSTHLLDPADALLAGDLIPIGRDRLLRNDGGGHFVEVGLEAGLVDRAASLQSTLFDLDGDGDLDLYQNDVLGPNRLWENQVIPTGELRFVDITDTFPVYGEVRLSDPALKSFSSAAADLNNDGWEDLVVWHRGPAGARHPMDRHLVWLNLGGEGLVEVGARTGMQTRWHDCEDTGLGVMGSQLADLDLDGFIDVFVGNGAPDGGCANQLWLADGLVPLEVEGWGTVMVPTFRDASDQIAGPVPGAESVPYPYRTHGACAADYDGDGRPELAFVNGGPGWAGVTVREPNRYFDIQSPYHALAIRPVGDGVAVAPEAIGTRVRVRVRRSSDGASWEIVRVLYGGSGFSAHNGPEIAIGLGDADTIEEVELTWPDGVRQTVDPPAPDARITVRRDAGR